MLRSIIVSHSPRSVLVFRSKSTLPNNSPVKWWERIRDFPKNVVHLYQDCQLIKDIYDASHTPRNQWTNHYGIMGKIPRRQQEQERLLASDLRVVVPLIVMYIPPIIGYLPMVFAIICPRQVLSRQFLTEHEKEQFAILEMKQRLKSLRDLSDHVWTSLVTITGHHHHHQEEFPQVILEEDAAGPILDLEPLFDEFLKTNLIHCDQRARDHHLTTLALAMGYAQRFPAPIPSLILKVTPKMWVAKEVKELARHVWRDDRLCLEEMYHLDNCQGMTDGEVREACLLRGLPVDITYTEMRECMTNHLKMMESLWNKKGDSGVPKQHFQIFALHLPAVRRYYKQQIKQ